MITLDIDFDRSVGVFKPLHGLNNGPIDYGELIDTSRYFKELRVPVVRLHDTNWPHPYEVDIPQVFPDFGADPEDPCSYSFERTDEYIRFTLPVGAKIIYRLGVSIEHGRRKYHTHPPEDCDRWAAICAGIARHYSLGWADGFDNAVSCWEVWNEPDLDERTWTGTHQQYLDLYAAAARAIKAVGPCLEVGGYGAADVFSPLFPMFLKYCRESNLPLDFFSWHTYAADPSEIGANARRVRDLLDDHGFRTTRSYLDEWNYFTFDWAEIWKPGNEYYWRDAFERVKGHEGAAFVVGSLIHMQDQPVDLAAYYDSQPSSRFCGLFDSYGIPTKAYYGMKCFRRLLDCDKRVECTARSGKNVYAAAGRNSVNGSGTILISTCRCESDELVISTRGSLIGETSAFRAYVLDDERIMEPFREELIHVERPEIRIPLKKHAVCCVVIGRQDLVLGQGTLHSAGQ